jgi:hypothetical protein
VTDPQRAASAASARRAVWGLALVLGVVHWDFWLWDDATLLFGFLPVGLAYHAVFSVLCGVVWALAVKFAWPEHIERWAEETEPS